MIKNTNKITKKSRCYYCKKKLGHIKWNCKCVINNFCSKCRLPENHECRFDFSSEENKIALKESLVKIEHEKVIKI